MKMEKRKSQKSRARSPRDVEIALSVVAAHSIPLKAETHSASVPFWLED
jgi:hypothetical protein